MLKENVTNEHVVQACLACRGVTRIKKRIAQIKNTKSRRSFDRRLFVYQSKAKSHSMNRIDLLKRPDVSRVSNILRKEANPSRRDGSPTTALLRLSPNCKASSSALSSIKSASATSDAPCFRGLTGGVHKAQDTFARYADPRLPAITASCSLVADYNLN